VRKRPQFGDISARSARTIHRGTTNHSETSRPVLVLGVDGPEAKNAEHHDMAVTNFRAGGQTEAKGDPSGTFENKTPYLVR
jgi:hypothetical protein